MKRILWLTVLFVVTASFAAEQAKRSSDPPSLTPVRIPPTPIPTVADGLVLPLGFEHLSTYDYDVPPMDMRPGAKPPKPVGTIPKGIRMLSGRKIAITGFMVPLKADENGVSEFVLLRNQMSCCFGVPPKPNEWIMVTMAGGNKTPHIPDTPLQVTGTFQVGEEFDEGFLTSIYRMKADNVAVKGETAPLR